MPATFLCSCRRLHHHHLQAAAGSHLCVREEGWHHLPIGSCLLWPLPHAARGAQGVHLGDRAVFRIQIGSGFQIRIQVFKNDNHDYDDYDYDDYDYEQIKLLVAFIQLIGKGAEN